MREILIYFYIIILILLARQCASGTNVLRARCRLVGEANI